VTEPGERSLDPPALGGQELACALGIHGATLPDPARPDWRARDLADEVATEIVDQLL
jgi:hypothetical protein